MSYQAVLKQLKAVARPEKAKFLPGFFQAFPGGYGEGDKFLGVIVPDQRQIAKQFRELDRGGISQLLQSPWHECRLTGLFILNDQFAKRVAERETIVHFYLEQLDRVNNWDLVDSSATKILGKWLLTNPKERKILVKLANSKSLWHQRTAVVATMPLIQSGDFSDFLGLASRLIDHPHDLMHKALGWMLREVGKRDPAVHRAFLTQYATTMPRTMLRYAIEKLAESERQAWLATRKK